MASWFDDNLVSGGPYASMAGPGTTTQPGATTSGTLSPDQVQAYIAKRQGELPPTRQSLEMIRTELQQQGIDAQWASRAGGLQSDDKLILPGGTMLDLIGDVNGANASWSYGHVEGPGGYGVEASQPGQGAYGAYMTPWDKSFTAPTAEQALASPGLQFAMQQAQQGMERSAAAQGTLLTGGLQKALSRYNTGAALQGYGDVYNRAMGEYGLDRENFWSNQDRPFNKLSTLSMFGQNAANQTGQYGSQYANQASGSLADRGNAQSAGSIAQGNIWSQLPNQFPYTRYY